MNNARIARLYVDAQQGRLTRRQVLNTALRLGLSSPAIVMLLKLTPESAAATPRATGSAARLPNPQADGSGTFTVLISSGTEDIDPHYSYATLSSTIALAAYEMLIQLKGESTDEYEPMLAASWEENADQTTYTFALFPDVLFQDGTPCDAQAVKDSYTRFLLQGAGPVNVISRFVEDPDQMEVIDPVTIRFNFSRPQPLFLPAMSSQYGPSVISPAAVDEHRTEGDEWAHEWLKANAVGSGPYRLVENILNERIVLERFEEYHRGWEGDHFDQIVFRVVPENATRRQLLEQGEADGAAYNLTMDDIEAMASNPDLQIVEYPTTAVSWAIMNAPRLETVEARQGLSYAFPYDEVAAGVFQNLLRRTGPIPDTVRGYDPDVFIYPTDLDRAKQLLTDGGFTEGDVFEYMFDANDERDTTVAQLFQANLQQIGFDLDLLAVDIATLENTIFGDAEPEDRPHLMSWGWWPDYNDPWNQMAPNFNEDAIGDGGGNGGFWVNARYEEIMAEAETFSDPARLDELMIEAQNIVTEQDPPAIYFGQVIRYTVLGSDIVGFVPNPVYLDGFNFYSMSRASE